MITDLLLAEMKSLALTIAPELKAAPLYIMRQPAELPCPTDATAYVLWDSCPLLQKHLMDCGRWEGPGWNIIFANDGITREQAIATLLHELAHVLPFRQPHREVPLTEDALAASHRELVSWCKAGPAPDAKFPAWHTGSHGKDFTRNILHLWWRAALAGEFLHFSLLSCCGRVYDLSPSFAYFNALGDEPIRYQREPFADILARQPPKDFRNLWQADLQYWMDQHPEKVAEVMKGKVA